MTAATVMLAMAGPRPKRRKGGLKPGHCSCYPGWQCRRLGFEGDGMHGYFPGLPDLPDLVALSLLASIAP
jgi:hypothetical protein